MSAPATTAKQISRGAPLGAFQRAWQRMAWKEGRQNLPLLSIFVLVMLITLVLTKYFVQSQPSHPNFGDSIWLGFVWTFTNIFALAIGVFIFAPEKENRTDRLLCILPVNSGFTVRAKLAVGLITVLVFALFGALCLWIEVAWLGSDFTLLQIEPAGMSRSTAIGLTVLTGAVVALECFFWGAICSLVFRRAIVAALVATACLIIFSWILPSMFGVAMAFYPATQPPVIAFVAAKLLIYVGMATALIYLGKRWLGHPSGKRAASRSPVYRADAFKESLVASLSPHDSESSRRSTRIYSALIWQSFRQYSTGLLLAFSICCPLFLLTLFIASLVADKIDWQFAISSAVAALGLIPLLSSMFVFSGDHQDQNYRFFQQHAEYGRKLWLARLCPAATVTVLSFILLATIVFFAIGFGPAHNSINGASYSDADGLIVYRGFLIAILFAFGTFAIGQFNSMFFRSGVFTFASAMVMASIAAAWIACLVFLGLSLWIFFLPIPVALLVVTWWRAPGWLADRNRVAEVAPFWIAVGLVTASVFVAMIYQRINEIQELSTSLSQQRIVENLLTSSQAKKSLASDDESTEFLLWDVAESMVDDPSFFGPTIGSGLDPMHPVGDANESEQERLARYVDLNTTAYQRLEQTPELSFSRQQLDADSMSHRRTQIRKLRSLLAARARTVELDGDLPVALEHWLQYLDFESNQVGQLDSASASAMLIRWGNQPGQSVDLIKQAIQALQFDIESWRHRAERESRLAQLDFTNWYEAQKVGIDDNASRISANFQYNRAFGTPWEMERSRRIAQNTIAQLTNRFQIFDSLALDSDKGFAPSWGPATISGFENAAVAAPLELTSSELFVLQSQGRWPEVLSILKQIQIRRYAQVQLALAGWKLEHGQYPESLVYLVPEYFVRLPVDVFYGGSFAYSSIGKDQRVGWLIRPYQPRNSIRLSKFNVAQYQYESQIPANTPFLLPWATHSGGVPILCQVESNPDIEPFLVYDLTDQNKLISGCMQDLTWSYRLQNSNSESEGIQESR